MAIKKILILILIVISNSTFAKTNACYTYVIENTSNKNITDSFYFLNIHGKWTISFPCNSRIYGKVTDDSIVKLDTTTICTKYGPYKFTKKKKTISVVKNGSPRCVIYKLDSAITILKPDLFSTDLSSLIIASKFSGKTVTLMVNNETYHCYVFFEEYLNTYSILYVDSKRFIVIKKEIYGDIEHTKLNSLYELKNYRIID